MLWRAALWPLRALSCRLSRRRAASTSPTTTSATTLASLGLPGRRSPSRRRTAAPRLTCLLYTSPSPRD
eukprot:14160992-Alexandrium_andersonii.AAC.1